ncbi:S8 family serine peptidase [Natronospora cellulosivora (SeqCode)]
MKKSLFIIATLIMVLLFTACSNFPGSQAIREESGIQTEQQTIDYSDAEFAANEILIKSNQPIKGILEENGIVQKREWPKIGWVLAEVTTGEDLLKVIDKLSSKEEILFVEPNLAYEFYQTTDAVEPEEGYISSWAIDKIKAREAWEITKGSSDVIVAVVDTGIDKEHSEFANDKIVAPYDRFNNDDEDIKDIDGHGTHISGIVASVAIENQIMPIRVSEKEKQVFSEPLIDALEYIVNYVEDNDVKIVANMSFGAKRYSYALKDAVDNALEAGVVLVAPAGNHGRRTLTYPASYNGVISVAASHPSGKRSDFSTLGYWNSVAAPGERIRSTIPGGYDYKDGTSMASAFVSGAAALLLSENPELTPIEVKNQLEQTAKGEGFTEELGYGVIDMGAMLGDLQEMKYGSLHVETDLGPEYAGKGLITLTQGNKLVAHGATGANGDFKFSALKPGSYTVNVSLNISGESYFNRENVIISEGASSEVYIEIN